MRSSLKARKYWLIEHLSGCNHPIYGYNFDFVRTLTMKGDLPHAKSDFLKRNLMHICNCAAGLSKFKPDLGYFSNSIRKIDDSLLDFPNNVVQDCPVLEKVLILKLSQRLLVENEFDQKSSANFKSCIFKVPPIFIVGQPKTGATLLFSLLSLDPGCKVVRAWQQYYPAESSGFYNQRRFLTSSPPHGIGLSSRDPDEIMDCSGFMEYGLFCTLFQNLFEIGVIDEAQYIELANWSLNTGSAPYEFHRRFVEVLSMQEHGCPTSHWVFKDAAHYDCMDSIAKVYPGARLVWTHRNLARQLADNMDLTDRCDGLEHMVHSFANSTTKALADRNELGIKRGVVQFHDVYFDDLLSDPIAAVKALYAQYQLSFNAAHEDAMKVWLSAHKHAPLRVQPQLEEKLATMVLQENLQYCQAFPRVVSMEK